MAADIKNSIFKEVDLNSKTNSTEHHTSIISADQLVVRRGQPFTVTLKLTQAFNPDLYPLTVTAATGEYPSEDQGTKSCFGIPDSVKSSPSAKAVWKIELHKNSSPPTGMLMLTITPPATTPIGQYTLSVQHTDQEMLLATLVVLFNPWCPDDWVFLPDEMERQEYVMNEQGTIYKGSGNYISPMNWDFGQFEDSMVDICLKMLDVNNKHLKDPADDVSARCNPIYVSRVVSAMINCQDDRGVLEGSWGSSFWGGVPPSQWNGSHSILKKWFYTNCFPVRYGQCWVFAGVMCSVMRLLGIPCRVVTNYESAHDNDGNLIIDVYHADYGVREKETKDSVWNFHVWVEGWMRRPDLAEDGKYDGWQVLDPTPQEKSDGENDLLMQKANKKMADLKEDIRRLSDKVKEKDSLLTSCFDVAFEQNKLIASVSAALQDTALWEPVHGNKKNLGVPLPCLGLSNLLNDTSGHPANGVYCCGPASVKAILNGDTDLKYDLPFVYAEVNADCIDWLVKASGSKVSIYSDTKRVGQNISTKAVGSNKRMDITDTYKYPEGSAKEREVFKYARTRNAPRDEEKKEDQLPPVTMRFEEVSKLVNGQDVSLKLVLHSESAAVRPLSINISVQAMRYNGTPAVNIASEVKEETLQPGIDLAVPILVAFSSYSKCIAQSDSMKISVMVTDKQKPDNKYLAVNDVVLMNPPISITVSGEIRLNREANVEVVFMNPVNETLRACTLTVSGSGLMEEEKYILPDLRPNTRILIKFPFVPYKTGEKTLIANFDCSTFRNIKKSCTVSVKP